MQGVRVAFVGLALAAGLVASGCKSEDTEGGTDTDGSTGNVSGGPHGNASLDAAGPSTFTGSPDDDDDDAADDASDDATPAGSTGRASATEAGGGEEDSGVTGEAGTGTGESTDTGGADDGAPGGECCMAQGGGGCGGGPIERCVCAEDEFCCTDVWDEVCTVQIVILGCGTCPGIGGDGDCCAPNGTPGCDDDAVEACVCRHDIVCCTQEWDQLCVDAVESGSCGRCP